MRVNKAVLPSMRARKTGLIIWVSSTLGRVLVGGGLYPVSKWAVEGFAESLHHQVEPFGIEVVILEPGSFPTPSTTNSDASPKTRQSPRPTRDCPHRSAIASHRLPTFNPPIRRR